MHWYWWVLIGLGVLVGLSVWAVDWMLNDIGHPK